MPSALEGAPLKLNDTKLRKLAEPGKYFDGGELYLELTKAGGRYWRMKYRFNSKEKRLAFGVYPVVGLKAVRELANEARKILQDNLDPGEVRKEEKAKVIYEAGNTLETVARDWLEHQAAPPRVRIVVASLKP